MPVLDPAMAGGQVWIILRGRPCHLRARRQEGSRHPGGIVERPCQTAAELPGS